MAIIHRIRSELRRRVVLVISVLVFVGLTVQASANSHLAENYVADLHGVDTVIVGNDIVPGHGLLPEHPLTSEEVKNPPPDPIFLVVKDIFSKQPWISVKMARDVPVQEWSKPNVIFFYYAVWARQESVDGKTFKIGSLVLQLRKYGPTGPKSAIAVLPVSYPFIILDNEKEFYKTLDESVRSLTSFLTGYFALANSDKPSNIDPNDKYADYPFGEKRHAPCPPPAKGQFTPVQCGTGEE
jgi:hypothetical protein